MKRKNILWLSHLVPYPPKGGVLQRSYNLLKEVSKHHNILLYALNQKGLNIDGLRYEKIENSLGQFCEKLFVAPIDCEEISKGKKIVAIKSLFSVNPYSINWLSSKKMFKNINDESLLRYIDVIHVDTIGLVPYINFNKDYKIGLNHHNIESNMMLRRANKEINVFKKIYYYQEGLKLKHYEKKYCEKFHVNITCSELDSSRLRKLGKNINTIEIPNGVDLEYFKPINSNKIDKSLIFAGSMDWYPNNKAVKYFVKNIWPLLKKEIPEVKMSVIGKAPPKEIIDLQKNDKDFIVTGFVDDVRPYIDEAMVYVCPINDGGGTKLKVLDALAMGKALVADPIACEGIKVRDGESVLFATKPSEYVQCIKKLFENPSLLHELGKNGMELVRNNYSFDSIGQKLAKIYSEL